MKIFQAGRRSGVYLIVRLEGSSNPFPQSSAYAWGFQKIVCYTAQDSRRRFTSSCASSDINTEARGWRSSRTYTKSDACTASCTLLILFVPRSFSIPVRKSGLLPGSVTFLAGEFSLGRFGAVAGSIPVNQSHCMCFICFSVLNQVPNRAGHQQLKDVGEERKPAHGVCQSTLSQCFCHKTNPGMKFPYSNASTTITVPSQDHSRPHLN